MNKDNVTAEDLVRAIQNNGVVDLAASVWAEDDYSHCNLYDSCDDCLLYAIEHLANLITLPENKTTTDNNKVVWRKGAQVPEPYKVVADYQDEVLPFSEPINGVEQ